MTKKKRKQILQLSGLHIFYIILCLLALVPILYALNLSFERGSGALSSGLSLFPKEFTLDNYKNILTQKPFLRWFYNSELEVPNDTTAAAIEDGRKMMKDPSAPQKLRAADGPV